MKKETQLLWVKYQLAKYGKVSRNKALSKYISRLGAYICDLRKTGVQIHGSYVDTKNGRDYVYTIMK